MFFIVYKLDAWSRELLSQLKMLIQINMYIVVMVLDWIPVKNFHYLTVTWLKTLLLLGLI